MLARIVSLLVAFTGMYHVQCFTISTIPTTPTIIVPSSPSSFSSMKHTNKMSLFPSRDSMNGGTSTGTSTSTSTSLNMSKRSQQRRQARKQRQKETHVQMNNNNSNNNNNNDSNNNNDNNNNYNNNYKNDQSVHPKDKTSFLPMEDNLEEPLQTISGGTSEIFSMARRMMVWNEDDINSNDDDDDDDEQKDNDKNGNGTKNKKRKKKNIKDNLGPTSPSSAAAAAATAAIPTKATPIKNTLPRWHPHEGIADSNPSFRHKPPQMNNKGYAMLIRRNSRKRNKQSLWRHAYRTYNIMKTIEEEQTQQLSSSKSGGTGGKVKSKLLIIRYVIHFEAALVSCAKLGLWREALSIYKDVIDIVEKQKSMNLNTVQYVQTTDGSTIKRHIPKIAVTDNMILSVVAACVRGAKCKVNHQYHTGSSSTSTSTNASGTTSTNANKGIGTESSTSNNNNNNKHEDELKFDKREPLDAAKEILLSMEEKYDIPIVSTHVNPLAAAYQHIGLYNEASTLIQQTLADRKTQAQDKEEELLVIGFNVNDVKAKDAASYNILIQGAITEGDWASAIGSLRDMTEKGLYPEGRSLNCWSETARKRERRAGSRKTTWKKNRERLITGTLPVSPVSSQTR